MPETNRASDEARQSLKAISDTKKLVADKSRAPKGYYTAVGGVMALIILGAAFPPTVSIPTSIVALVLVGALVTWYSKTVPTWAYGKLWDKDSLTFWVMTLIAAAALILSITTGNVWVAVPAAALTWATWSILGPHWDKAYRRQLEAR